MENVGIIFLAVGAGMLFQSYGLPPWRSSGSSRASITPSTTPASRACSFLGCGCGAACHAHARTWSSWAGSIKGMPRTALVLPGRRRRHLGLPPLNGFVSEWLVFQALPAAVPSCREPSSALLMPLAVGMLALTSGLAAACFVKAFGIIVPRDAPLDPRRRGPGGAAGTMQVGDGRRWRSACVALGVVPSARRAGAERGRSPGWAACRPTSATALPALTLEMPGTVGVIAPAVLAAGLVLVPVAVVRRPFRLGAADRRLRVGRHLGLRPHRPDAADGVHGDRVRRAAAGGSSPSCTARPRTSSIDFHPESRYFVQSIAYRSEVHPWFERLLYAPVVSLLRRTAFRIRWLQAGSLHLYLLYMILALDRAAPDVASGLS